MRTFDGLKEFNSKPASYIGYNFQLQSQSFTYYTKQMEMMNTSDLRDYLKMNKIKVWIPVRNIKIELYRRTADPLRY